MPAWTLGFLAVVACAVAYAVPKPSDFDVLALASFVPTILATALLIAREADRRPYSLNMMHLIFCYLYLGTAPLAQYLHGQFPLSIDLPFVVDAPAVYKTNLVVGLWLLCYWLGYGRNRLSPAPGLLAPLEWRVTWFGLTAAAIAACAALAWLFSLGFFGAVTRRGAEIQVSEVSSFALFNDVVVRAVPILALGALLLGQSVLRGTTRGLMILSIVVFAVAVALIDNPLAAPRYYTGMAVLGLAAIVLLRRMRTGAAFVPLIVLGILFAMPILNQGRRELSAEAYLRGVREPEYIDAIIGGDFDAYSGVVRTREYVAQPDNITWGRQLLGVALFWIPRSTWPDKPIGSGTHVALEYGWVATNVSAPLPAEALINFGWLGIPLFAFAFGRILRRVDDLYWKARAPSSPGNVRLIDLVYPFWLGLVIFLSRGDLLSGFAYSVGVTFAALPLLAGARRPAMPAAGPVAALPPRPTGA